jgi:hypothetical protein
VDEITPHATLPERRHHAQGPYLCQIFPADVQGTAPDAPRIKEHYPSSDPATFRKMAYEALAQIKI